MVGAVIAGVLIVATVSFAGGYIYATKSSQKQIALAITEATALGAAAQEQNNKTQREAAAADSDNREKILTAREQRFREAVANFVIPQNPQCVVDAETMKLLNEVTQ